MSGAAEQGRSTWCATAQVILVEFFWKEFIHAAQSHDKAYGEPYYELPDLYHEDGIRKFYISL
jgi:hypothetical protein